jgi:hypothetical protein
MTKLVPENIIACIAHNNDLQNQENVDLLFRSLKGEIKRDWFVKHAYFCLPLVMGNQHGFVLRSLYDFTVEWNGGERPEDVIVTHLDDEYHNTNAGLQSIRSHFGMGTITIQTTFTLRTPDGINLMTINPPNMYVDGLYHMTGVIESDNLRRDFTFNLRATRPNYKVQVKKGDPIGCIIPYPRHFIDKYQMKNAVDVIDPMLIINERKCAADHGEERSKFDKNKLHGNGRRYHNGEDVYGNKFKDHQTHLDD